MRKEENMDIPEYYPYKRLTESLNRIEDQDLYTEFLPLLDDTLQKLNDRENRIEEFRRTWAEIKSLPETP